MRLAQPLTGLSGPPAAGTVLHFTTPAAARLGAAHAERPGRVPPVVCAEPHQRPQARKAATLQGSQPLSAPPRAQGRSQPGLCAAR